MVPSLVLRARRLRSAVVVVAAVVSLSMPASPVLSQEHQELQEHHGDNRVWGANRALAARFTQDKLDKLIFDVQVRPHWLEGSENDQFWYPWEDTTGKTFWIVDPVRGTKEKIFDNADMAAQLTLLTKDPYDAQHLPIGKIRWVNDNTAIQFDVTSSQDEVREETEGDTQEEEGARRRPKPKKKVHHFEYDLSTRQVRELEDFEAPPEHPEWAGISPDKQWVVFSREYDLYMMSYSEYEEWLDKEKAKKEAGEEEEKKKDEEAEEPESDVDPDIEEIRLSTDGEQHYGYGFGGRGDTDDEREKNSKKRQRVFVSWSHDGSRFALVRRDQRKVKDLWVIHNAADPRPKLETYRYDMPGEKNATQSEIWVFDVAERAGRQLDTAGFVDQTVNIFTARRFPRPDAEEPIPSLWLSESADELYWGRISRDLYRYDVVRTNLATNTSEVLIEERLNTYVEVQPLELLPDGDLVWWSERDGWGHYYRFAADGTLKNQITRGEFSGRGIEGVDAAAGAFYFEATGGEEGDPYYRHLYRVNLDGSGLTVLNAGDFDTSVSLSESNRFFVNNFSRVDTVPEVDLRNRNGQVVMALETADLSLLMEAGFEFPEPFRVKADDSITDLYGVMYKPFDFDESKRYPIIAYVYPGPQTESVTKSFSTRAQNVHLAQMGFIVIEIGNRGGHPWRSKWYHNYGYGNLRDYGLADKKTAIEQLAARHPFVDVERVGIFGHSGGGFMSTAAMLVYPDFFKVAVSSSGNHENQVYNRWWSEKHHGVKETTNDKDEVIFEYDIDRNSQLAGNLKGHLLLTTGDVDNNVHPAGTIRMAQALMRAHKRFDFFLFPGERHGYREFADYWEWLRADYFAEHLLGDPPHGIDMLELNREEAKNGKGRRGAS